MVALAKEKTLVEQFTSARNVGTSLLAIETPDGEATMIGLCELLNGDRHTPVIQWDVARGLQARNVEGGALKAALIQAMGNKDKTQGNAALFVKILAMEDDDGEGIVPTESLIFMVNAHRFFGDVAVMQAIVNLRDMFKENFRTLVMLGKGMTLPTEMTDDVVLLDEPLPDTDTLRGVVEECHLNMFGERGDYKKLTPKSRDIALEAIRGLALYPAEQCLSMSLVKDGSYDMDALWHRKRKMIEQTPGLTVYRGNETFAQIGGNASVKEYLSCIMEGKRKPRVVVWLDEIEKSGLGHTGDSSGVNADALGTTLSFMEDNDVFGCMLLGAPGTGKSAIAKALGDEHGVLTVRIDMGAMQDKHVGESQSNLRQAFKMIHAIGGDEIMVVATSNSVEGLDSALKSRFTKVFFFDLPNEEEKQAIWKIWTGRFKGLSMKDVKGIDDKGWSGRNIKQCCSEADRSTKLTLAKSAKWIIPTASTARKDIADLRTAADDTYLSAAHPGAYHIEHEADVKKTRRAARTD